MESKPDDPIVCIVDDNASVRRALVRLVESMQLSAEVYASPEELLRSAPADDEIACLLLDVQLPGMDGFELHRKMVEGGHSAPVIFITGHPDARSRSRAKEARAVAYLEKPFDDRSLFDAIRVALGDEMASPEGTNAT